MKIALLIGEPGVGKSTLTLQLLRKLPAENQTFALKKAAGTYYPECRLWVLGKYPPGDLFGGTDKLSMAVQPDALEWIDTLGKNDKVFLEGDRLGNGRFVAALRGKGHDVQIFWLKSEYAAARRAARGTKQDETWLQGRRTKVFNLAQQFGHVSIGNDSEEQAAMSVEVILGWLFPGGFATSSAPA